MAKKSICVSDLKHIIEIDTKTNINKGYNQVDYNKEYKAYYKAYAKVENKPVQVYSGVNMSLTTSITHIFTIKYPLNIKAKDGNKLVIDKGKVILFKGKIFNIEATYNLNEENDWLVIHAIEDRIYYRS